MNVMNGGSVMAPAVPPPGTLPPGTQIQLGQYTVVLERYIAEGGFAHVYLAGLLGGPPSTVVVKRIAVADKERLAIVNNEIETMKRLGKHKNIVEYMDSTMGKLEGGGYEVLILMENCAGGPVIDIMNRRLQHRLTEPEILKIFSNVCEAVAYMHYQDPPVLHRDIKVENILLSHNQYKLCDFGSATTNILRGDNIPKTVKDIQLLEEDINNHTTLQYRAPEMLDLYMRKGIDEKIDIWALGVLLYKLCYYTTPFEEQGQLAILNARYTIPDQPIFSNELKGLIRSMLKEEPSQRPNIYQVLERTSAIRGLPCPIQNKYSNTTSAATNPSASSTAASMDIFTTAPISRPVDTLPSIAPMRRGRPTRSPAPGLTPNQVAVDSFPSSNTKPEGTLDDGFGGFPSTMDFKAGFDDSFGASLPAPGASSALLSDDFGFGRTDSNSSDAAAKFSLGFEEPKTNVGDFGFSSTVPPASAAKVASNSSVNSSGSSKGPRPMSTVAAPTSAKPTAMDLLMGDTVPSSTTPAQAPSAQLTGPSLQARLRSLGLGGGDVTSASNASSSGHSAPVRPSNPSHRSNNSISSSTSASNQLKNGSSTSTNVYPPLSGTKHDNMELLQRQQLEQFGQFSTESTRPQDNRGKAKILDPSKTLDGLKQQSSNNSSPYLSSNPSIPTGMSPDVSGMGSSPASLNSYGSRSNPRPTSLLPTPSQGTTVELSGATAPVILAHSTSSDAALDGPPPKPSHNHHHSQSNIGTPSSRAALTPKPSGPVKPGRSNSDEDEIQRIREQFERQRRELLERQQRQMEEQQREHRLEQERLQEQQMRELQLQQEKWIAKRRAQKEQDRLQQQKDSQLPSQLSGRSATNFGASSPSSGLGSPAASYSQQSPDVSTLLSTTSSTSTTTHITASKKPLAGGSSNSSTESNYVSRTAYSSSSNSTGAPTAPPRSSERPRAVTSESSNSIESSSGTRSRGLSASSNSSTGRTSSQQASLPPGKKPELMPKPTRFRMKDGAGSLAVGEEEAFKRRFPSADDFDLDEHISATISGSNATLQSGINSTRSSIDYARQVGEEEDEEETLSRRPRRAREIVKEYERVSAPASGASIPLSNSAPRGMSSQNNAPESVGADDQPAASVRERVQRMNRGG
ncbi:hypothetical protein BGW42_007531 [Actinomortierella wolfii]|nr:hypothetical protein BGW42_007531 [Actinomortierella wolfii]